MPRTRKTPAPAPPAAPAHLPVPVGHPGDQRPRAFVASGRSMANVPDTTASKFSSAAAWQDRAWGFYDQVGELRFGANWLGNAMSRVRLMIVDGKGEEVTSGPAFEFLKQLFGGEEGQSQALRTMGVQLTVPGESWVIGRGGVDTGASAFGADQWMVVSESEIRRQGKQWLVDRGDGVPFLLDVPTAAEPDGNDVVARIWRSHPRKYAEADSPVRSMLGVLAELLQLTKKVAASIDSRLAGAGILLLPSEAEFQAPATPSGSEPTAKPTLADALMDSIMTPIDDPADATALVPFILQAPGAALAGVQHIRFDTELSAEDRELRIELLRRLGLGMDLPVEVLLGQGDSNHWSAWQVDESAIKIHIEPMCELICAAFTSELLHPFLQGGRDTLAPEDRALSFKADTSDLRLRPNRPAEAQALNAEGLVTDETVRRENGFDEGDKPDENEKRDIVLRRLALGSGSTSPEIQLAALRAIGIDLDVELPEAPQETAAPALAAVPDVTEETGPPEPLAASGGQVTQFYAQHVVGLNVAAHLLVQRALERARNKYGRRAGSLLKPLTEQQAREGLAGTLDQCPKIAASFGYSPDNLTRLMTAYCTSVLTSGSDHDERILHQLVEGYVHREHGRAS